MSSDTGATRGERGVLVRSVLVGAVCGLGAVVAHAVAADGHLDAGASAAVLAAGLGVGPVLVRAPSLPRLLGGTVALQLLAHAVMALTMTGSMGLHAAHLSGSPVQPWVGAASDGGAVMAGAHLAIALVTAALARGADRAVCSLVRERWRAALGPAPAASLVPAGRRVTAPHLAVLAPHPCRRVRPAGPRAPPRRPPLLAPSA